MFFVVLKVWGNVEAYAVRHVQGYVRALRKQGKIVEVLYATHTPRAVRRAYEFNGKVAEDRATLGGDPLALSRFVQED